MRNFGKILVAATLMFSTSALAQQRAGTEEAKTMAIKAVEHLKSVGADIAYKSFTEKAPGWVDRDLYVFVIKDDGTVVAHGSSAALIGKNLSGLKDVDGKPFVKEMTAVKAASWVDYKWKNPQSGAVEAKTSYVIPISGGIIAVGAYK